MKIVFVLLFILSGCSNVSVYPLKTFVELNSKDLKKESLKNFSISYKSYLLLECVQILQKESGLLIDEPIYASASKWNSFENYFESIFSFYTLVDNIPKEVNMECDVAVNDKKEVDKYRVRNYSLSLIKKD